MMYEVNWCGIYMPIWLVCLVLGALLSVVLGKVILLVWGRRTMLTADYESLALIFAFVFWSVLFGKR